MAITTTIITTTIRRRIPTSNGAEAIEALLIEKGLVTKEALDTVVDLCEHDIGPMNGARVVARAWVDEAYKKRLLDDGSARVL